jgi:hypothetical protein
VTGWGWRLGTVDTEDIGTLLWSGRVLCLDLSGDYMGASTNQNSLSCTLLSCVFCGVYIIPHLKIKIICDVIYTFIQKFSPSLSG